MMVGLGLSEALSVLPGLSLENVVWCSDIYWQG